MHDFILKISLILACLVPLLIDGKLKPSKDKVKFQGFPSQYEGRSLTPLSLNKEELRFYKSFPGEIARYSDGERELLMRWIDIPTRQLHPAADCFRGSGYTIVNYHLSKNSNGQLASCFVAYNTNDKKLVCELIFDQEGNSWSDPSSWYWDSIFKNLSGPWWSITSAKSMG